MPCSGGRSKVAQSEKGKKLPNKLRSSDYAVLETWVIGILCPKKCLSFAMNKSKLDQAFALLIFCFHLLGLIFCTVLPHGVLVVHILYS